MSINNFRACKKCGEIKNSQADFYHNPRCIIGTCKKCMSLAAITRQRRKRQLYGTREPTDRERERSKAYYAAHKEQFKVYRERFLKKYPDYFKKYYRARRDDEG